ncbi:MAG: hypothetical protein JWM80_620 [Cyanobacteria bacterium RYN_339]|nr:hypothetical protein [Cyanobacteria bacterium RYN_339]
MLATWMLAPVIAASLATAAPQPVQLGVTPVLAPPVERSFPLAMGLTYGMPVAIGLAGGLLVLPFGDSPVRNVVLGPIGLACVGSLASGYMYAGDPWRGVLVTMGDFGVIIASMLVSAGVAVAVTGGGQQAGFIIALVGTPIVLGGLTAYEVWKMRDLHDLIERKNAEARQLRR